jgi:hypothetical protein
MEEARRWLDQYERFWTAQLDRLEAFLEEEECSTSQSHHQASTQSLPGESLPGLDRPGADQALVRAGTDPSLASRFRAQGRRSLVREVITDAKLVYTWAWRSTPERESLVTVEFAPDGTGTLLTLTHAQFFDEPARDRHRHGWDGALDKLERYFA